MAATSPHSVVREVGCRAAAAPVVVTESRNSARALCSPAGPVPEPEKCQWRHFGCAWRLLVLGKSPAMVTPVAHPGLLWWQLWCFTALHVPGRVRAGLCPCRDFLSVRADYSAKAAMWQSCLHCFTELGCLLSPSIISWAGNRILMVEVQIRFSCRTLMELAARGTCWLCREQDHCAENHHHSWVLEYICLHQNSLPRVCILSCWWEA